VTRNQSKLRDPDDVGRVVQFPQRRMAKPPASGSPDNEPADAFARYEAAPDDAADYRQRMLMNVIAAAIVASLIGAGIWIAGAIAEMDKDQDCAMQGRANCAPIEAPAANRR
jgi:hypothetical protein